MRKPLPDELIFLTNRNLPQHVSTESMEGKTVVVTGATSGVGLSAVKELLKANATILVVARNESKVKQMMKDLNTTFDYVIADFAVLNDVRRAAEEVLTKVNAVDVLINSAGLHSTRKTYTKDGHETVFQVNHLSALLFTKLLLPNMLEHGVGRIIQVNSEGHRFNGLKLNDLDWKKRIYSGLRGYGASKTAQLMSVWEMNDELKGTGITINAMHPGDVKTSIGSNNGILYKVWTKLFTNRMLRDVSISGSALYYLASSPKLASVSGKFFHLTIEEPPAKHAMNRTLGKQVYEASLKMIEK